MSGVDRRVAVAAAEQGFMITRLEALELGSSDDAIYDRVVEGAWMRIHAGVFQIDRRPLDWESQLRAAVLAAGPGSLVSHRSALRLWGLDGIATAVVELTMPFGNLAFPEGVIVHRSRRLLRAEMCKGIPVTSVERTLLDCAALLPKLVLGKALDSAIRKGLTTMDQVYDVLVAEGGRGVKGTRSLRWVLKERIHETATDSGSEFELLYHMQMGFLPRPELQYAVAAPGGRRELDFFWPDLGKAIEVDGIDAHSSADRLDDDLKRQNELMDIGIELRRFSAREVRRNPGGVVEEIRRFLAA